MFVLPMISNQIVVLSEAQSYGMLITVEAAKKGQAHQEDFDRLYQYYLKHRLEGHPVDVLETNDLRWKGCRLRIIMQQMGIFILLILC